MCSRTDVSTLSHNYSQPFVRARSPVDASLGLQSCSSLSRASSCTIFVCVCVQFSFSGWGTVLMEPGLMSVSLWGPYTLFCSPYTSTIILSSYFRSTAELWPPAFLDMLTSTCPGKAEGSEGYHVLGATPLHGQRLTGAEVDSGLHEHWRPQQLYKHNFSMQTCWDFFRRLSRENQNNPKEPPKHGGSSFLKNQFCIA